jgi:L-fuculose-phosphate aldolase
MSVVAFTIAEKPILPIIGAYNPNALRLVHEGIPTYPRSVLINNPERGRELAGVMGASRVCLMRGHGITTAGVTIEEATLTAIQLNDLAELHYQAETLGGAKPIADEDLQDILGNLPPDVSRREGPPRPPSSEWRYYSQAYGQM